jgi:hypothetical protein
MTPSQAAHARSLTDWIWLLCVAGQRSELEIQMDIDEIKAAVDSGQSVHWANEGYRIHKDNLGQYLITYELNGSTIGLTDQSGHRLNGDEADFFVSDASRYESEEKKGGARTGCVHDYPGREAG